MATQVKTMVKKGSTLNLAQLPKQLKEGYVLNPDGPNTSANTPTTRRKRRANAADARASGLMPYNDKEDFALPIYFPGKVSDLSDWQDYFQDSLKDIPIHDIMLSSSHAIDLIPSYDSTEFIKGYSEFINAPENKELKDRFNLRHIKKSRKHATRGGSIRYATYNNCLETYYQLAYSSEKLTDIQSAYLNDILRKLKEQYTTTPPTLIEYSGHNGLARDLSDVNILYEKLLVFINISSRHPRNPSAYSQFLKHFYLGQTLQGCITDHKVSLIKKDGEDNNVNKAVLNYSYIQNTDSGKKKLYNGTMYLVLKYIYSGIEMITWRSATENTSGSMSGEYIENNASREKLELICISALNQMICKLSEDAYIFYLFLTILTHIDNNNRFFKPGYFSEECIISYTTSGVVTSRRSNILLDEIKKVKKRFSIGTDTINSGIFFSFQENSNNGGDINISHRTYRFLDGNDEYIYFINTLLRMIFNKDTIVYSLIPSITYDPLYIPINNNLELLKLSTKEATNYRCVIPDALKPKIIVREHHKFNAMICNDRWVADRKNVKYNVLKNPRINETFRLDNTSELSGILSRLVYSDTNIISSFFKGTSINPADGMLYGDVRYLTSLDPDPEWEGQHQPIKHRIHVFYRKKHTKVAEKGEVQVFIVFRGSLTSRDWADSNVGIARASESKIDFNYRISQFSLYISEIINAIKNKRRVTGGFPDGFVRFYSTGHSLGGYLALMLSSYSYSLLPYTVKHFRKKQGPSDPTFKYYSIIEPIVFNPYCGVKTIIKNPFTKYRDSHTNYLEIIRSGKIHRIVSHEDPDSRLSNISFNDVASSSIYENISNTTLNLIEYENIYNHKDATAIISGIRSMLVGGIAAGESHAMHQFIGLISFYMDSLESTESDPIHDVISIRNTYDPQNANNVDLEVVYEDVFSRLNTIYKFMPVAAAGGYRPKKRNTRNLRKYKKSKSYKKRYN